MTLTTQKKFYNTLINIQLTQRSLKQHFDLYWAVRLFHEVKTDKSIKQLDFLKLFSNKALLEGCYIQFKEAHLVYDCLQIMLERGVAPLENVNLNNDVYIKEPINYFELYRNYTDLCCDAVYRKKFVQ